MVTGPNRTGTCTHAAENRRPGTPREAHQPPDLARAHGGADPVAEGRPDAGQAAIRERTHAHAIDAAGPADELDERVHGVVLGVDVDPDVGPGGQDVLEQGISWRPRTRSMHLGPRQVADGARAVGQAVEGVVVEGDDAVGGGMHVGLEVAVAERDGGLERLHGVLAAGLVEVGALVRGWPGGRASRGREGEPWRRGR